MGGSRWDQVGCPVLMDRVKCDCKINRWQQFDGSASHSELTFPKVTGLSECLVINWFPGMNGLDSLVTYTALMLEENSV